MRDRVTAETGDMAAILSLETHALTVSALSRNPSKLRQMTLQVGDQVREIPRTAHPHLDQWLRCINIFSQTVGRPPTVTVIADGDEFTAQDVGGLLGAATQAAAEAGCAVRSESLCDVADVTICIGPRLTRTLGRAETTLRLRPVTTLDDHCPDLNRDTVIDTAIGAVSVESDFSVALPSHRPLLGVHAPRPELQLVIAQAVAHILRSHEALAQPYPNSFTTAVLDDWTSNGRLSSPLSILALDTGDVAEAKKDTPQRTTSRGRIESTGRLWIRGPLPLTHHCPTNWPTRSVGLSSTCSEVLRESLITNGLGPQTSTSYSRMHSTAAHSGTENPPGWSLSLD